MNFVDTQRTRRSFQSVFTKMGKKGMESPAGASTKKDKPQNKGHFSNKQTKYVSF